ncbi:MAG: hypothetical protein JSS65_03155 [Armatimonadetes bacterium]|nr:hypothetical protein [Armatimonadota bacterium]
MKRAAILLLAALSPLAQSQFVWPKPEYNVSKPGLYTEDPFIVEYRKKFFSVFRGDYAAFDKAYKEIEAMVGKNPKDARALVWLGNGQMIKAAVSLLRAKDKDKVPQMLAESRKTLDKAVALKPDDPNIYMMRAVTLSIIADKFPAGNTDKKLFTTLRDDCLKFIKFIGPKRMEGVSIHMRGEALASLAQAYTGLGNKAEAVKTYKRLASLNKGTDYEPKALAKVKELGG